MNTNNDQESVDIIEGVCNFVSNLRSIAEVVGVYVESLREAFKPVLDEIRSSCAQLIERAQKWQQEQKVFLSVLAEHGWFPNWFTFFYSPEEEIESIDDFMMNHIDECWDDLKAKILDLCPKRSELLEEAFKLHEEGRYIASIPILLCQADGICSEEITHFFSKDPNTKNRASDEILEKCNKGELDVDFLSEILLEPFKIKLQLSAGSSKCGKKAKSKGPNRHGIIHGSRKHLDYGTKENGYKSVSFLAFIVFTTKDVFKKQFSKNIDPTRKTPGDSVKVYFPSGS